MSNLLDVWGQLTRYVGTELRTSQLEAQDRSEMAQQGPTNQRPQQGLLDQIVVVNPQTRLTASGTINPTEMGIEPATPLRHSSEIAFRAQT